MNTLFNENDYNEIMKRISNLKADSPRLWGKMNADQMLAHCNGAMKTAVGELNLKRLFIGRIIGKLVKKSFLNDKPLAKNSPTAKEFIFVDKMNFEKEKAELLAYCKRFHEGGENGATKHPHGFFGKLTPAEWGVGQWKHLDHHLRQFGG